MTVAENKAVKCFQVWPKWFAALRLSIQKNCSPVVKVLSLFYVLLQSKEKPETLPGAGLCIFC